MARRHMAESLKVGTAMDSPEAVAAYLQAQLRDAEHEIFALLLLDSRHRVLAFEPISQGTINAATAPQRSPEAD